LRWVALCVALCWVIACAASRDVVPETRDVHGAPDASAGGYAYVAKRPHGLVALAEARGIDDASARQAVDHLADELDACAARLAAQGKLASDAAGRVVAQIGPEGDIAGLNVKTTPGGAAAANFLLCVVSPLRMTGFPRAAGDAGARGVALEAVWGSSAGAAR
jgi:hypothetical protein